MFALTDIHVAIEGKEIVKGVSLNVGQGELHVLMGPNGSGKTSLAYALMGHPRYQITSGSFFLNTKDLTRSLPEERARAGLFLSFQYPLEIAGVSMANFLRTAKKMHSASLKDEAPVTLKKVEDELRRVRLPREFAERGVNEGFSGGEKKRAEILQLRFFKPLYAILDECDSGLDVDGLKLVASSIRELLQEKDAPGILLITHYARILDDLPPHAVHIMRDGLIVSSGDSSLAKEVERTGYERISQLESAKGVPVS